MAASETRLAEADSSFERLYRTHRRDVYNFVLHDVRNPDEAEDVTQVAFLNAYRALRRGRPPEKPRAWLFTIAQNVSRRRFRRRAGHVQEVPLDTEIAVSAPDDYDGPTADEICAAFRELPDMQRAALAMRELQGRSYAEIADELDLTISAVETLIFRARRALRTHLEPEPSRLPGFLALPLALPGALAKALGAVATSLGRTGLIARAAGVAGAIVVGGAAVEFVPPLLAAEEPTAVEEIAPPKSIPAAEEREATSAVALRARDEINDRRRKAGAASAAGGPAAGKQGAGGGLPELPLSAPEANLPDVTVPGAIDGPSVPGIDVPDVPDVPGVPGVPDVPDLPDVPDVPDLPELPLPPAPPPPALETPDLGTPDLGTPDLG